MLQKGRKNFLPFCYFFVIFWIYPIGSDISSA